MKPKAHVIKENTDRWTSSSLKKHGHYQMSGRNTLGMGGNIAAMYLIGDLSLQLNNKYINNPI
jgi:hypothetical protein